MPESAENASLQVTALVASIVTGCVLGPSPPIPVEILWPSGKAG